MFERCAGGECEEFRKDGTSGGAEAAGESGAAGQRAGGGEPEGADDRRRRRSGARRFGRSCRSWGWRRSSWLIRAVKDDIYRSEDGRLMAQGGADMRDYLAQFVGENPELLPARLAGGRGRARGSEGRLGGGVDLDKIRPGMSAEEMERVRQEIARVASQTLRGM